MPQKVTITIIVSSKQRALNYVHALPVPDKNESISFDIETIEKEKQTNDDKLHRKAVKR